uniref:Nuclear RNA export factor 1-like n=2 Tax=Gouania willdenowi TaxID=441366 RepID=A0A8C5EFK8_GOUWI
MDSAQYSKGILKRQLPCKNQQFANHLGGTVDLRMSHFQCKHNPYKGTFWSGDDLIVKDLSQANGGGGRAFRVDRTRRQFRSNTSWFKVTIPYRGALNLYLLQALQNICPIPYVPIEHHVDQHTVTFYVNGSAAATALRKCSHKLKDCYGRKIVVNVKRCGYQDFLSSAQLNHIERCMAKRFNCNLQALDLNNIDKDPDLVSQKVKLLLNKKTSMEAVIKIVEGNVPRLTSLNLSNNCIQRLDELSKLVPKVPNLMALDLSQNNLQSECELDKLKGLNLVELWLVGNPLCALFKDANSYASAMCQRFPQLQKLDGTPLFQPTVIDAPSTIVSPETSFTCFNIYGFIERFVQNYYDVCDSDDRTLMLQAYYEDALFKHTKLHHSQILPMNGQDVDNPLDIDQDVVTFLNKLPKTQHDRSSFHVKVNAFTNTRLEFTVSGNYTEFKELRTNGISFIRNFVALPSDHGGLCIINDQVFTKKVPKAQKAQISGAFVGPTTNPFFQHGKVTQRQTSAQSNDDEDW